MTTLVDLARWANRYEPATVPIVQDLHLIATSGVDNAIVCLWPNGTNLELHPRGYIEYLHSGNVRLECGRDSKAVADIVNIGDEIRRPPTAWIRLPRPAPLPFGCTFHRLATETN